MSLVEAPDPEVFLSERRFEAYRGASALVTGGLGFVGSTLAHALTTLGCRVTAVDSLTPLQGGNRFNLNGIEDKVNVRIADIRDREAMEDAVSGCDFVFNIAARTSHLDSMADPFEDLDVNARGTLVMLEAVRKRAPTAPVVYSGTRSAYGLIRSRPVSEEHPLHPTEVNSANRAVADLYHVAYALSHGIKAVSMRLPNTYGPRMHVKNDRLGFMNWFLRLAVEGGTFRLYGDGTQVRDLVYVDDVARAMLLAAVTAGAEGEVLNIGSGRPVSVREIAEMLTRITCRGKIEYVPFPEDAKRIEIGDYVADITKISTVLDWRPLVSLRDGLERSVHYFEKYREHYW